MSRPRWRVQIGETDSLSMKHEADDRDAGGGRGAPAEGIEGTVRTAHEGWTLERVVVVAGFAVLVIAVVVLTNGDPSLLGPSVVVLVPGLVFTLLLLWKPGPRTFLAAGIANSLVAIIAIPFGLGGALANPLLGPFYVGVVLVFLSLLLSLPFGILGFLRGTGRFRRRTLVEGIFSLQGLYAIIVAAIAAGAMSAGFLAYQNLPVPSTNPGETYDFTPAKVSMLTANFRFEPSRFNVTVNVVTQITVLNEDDALHTFTYSVNATTYNHDLLPGSTTRFLVFFTTPGTIPYWCIPHRDSGMVGNITVVP